VLSCRELHEQHASDHVDGCLSARNRLAVRLHLALCSNCRRFIQQLRRVKSVLRERPDVALPDSEAKPLATRLQAALREQQKNSSG